MTLTEKIVKVAKSYVGQKEKPNNSGFVDPLFEQKQKARGWLHGQAWCAYTAELIWYDAFTELDACAVPLINKYFSGSTLQTFKNFKASPEFAVRAVPKLGAVAIWQHGSSTAGHAGIVTFFTETTFKSVEGNTSEKGSREGTIVLENYHEIVKPYTSKGLNLLGFVHPIRIK